MHSTYPPYSNGTAAQAAALPYPAAANSSQGYPAQQLHAAPQHIPQQQLYPNMAPLATDTYPQQQQQQQQPEPSAAAAQQLSYANAPAGDPYSQPYPQPYPQQQQQQQQQPCPSVSQPPYPQQQQQQQGTGYPTTSGLADDLHKLNLQHAVPNASSGYHEAYPQQQQQQQPPYGQPYPQQQQQQLYPQTVPQAVPYLHSDSGNSQQYGSSSNSQRYSDPGQQLYSNTQQYGSSNSHPYPSTQGGQQQLQQPQYGSAPQYGSSNSHPYPYPGSQGASQQQQQQQQQQAPPCNSGQQYGSSSSSSSHPYPYPSSTAGLQHQLQHYDSSSSSSSYHYSTSGAASYGSQHYASFGAASLNSSLHGPAAASDAQRPSQYPGSTGSDGTSSTPYPQPYPQQQQQQPDGALPPYPRVPQSLPVMPYNAAPEKVCQGYDVMFYIQNAKNLPSMDWWNGAADPYVIITANVGGQQIHYKTAHKRATVNPEYDNEFFQVGNLPKNTTFFVEVWDKDVVTDDDVIGRTSWNFCPQEMLPASAAGGGLVSEDQTWGRLLVKLPLKHPSKANKKAGEIELEVCYRPSTRVAAPRMLGPVKFRQHLSPNAGLFTGHWWSNGDMSYMTYKLFLVNISSVFDGVRMPWNKNYDKAQSIFRNPVVLNGIRAQHSALYSTHRGNTSRGGMLSSAADFFEVFHNGMRGGERRFFTYVLCEDSLRCSETGAAFFNDMFSKHAMHSGGQEEVLFAGEFCIIPCPGCAGGHKLVIDNNSGTYAPDKTKLPLMEKLFKLNFPDMTVEVLDMKDPRLQEYQKMCPSRLTLAQQHQQQQQNGAGVPAHVPQHADPGRSAAAAAGAAAMGGGAGLC